MAAVGGTMAGFAAATLGTQLIAGAMIAGGALTAVGVLTGSKKLQKFGGVLSLAGGVAGLASGAWQTAATEIGNGAFLGEGVASGVPAWDSAAGGAGLSGASGGIGAVADLGAINEANQAVSGAMGAPAAPSGIAGNQAATNALNSAATAPPVSGGGGMLKTITSGVGDTLKSGMAWAKANPQLTQGLMGITSAGLGYVGQQEAVKDKIQLEEEAKARARQRLNDSVKGVRVPVYQPLPRG